MYIDFLLFYIDFLILHELTSELFPLERARTFSGLGSYKLKYEVDFANIHKHLINHTSISSFLEIKMTEIK